MTATPMRVRSERIYHSSARCDLESAKDSTTNQRSVDKKTAILLPTTSLRGYPVPKGLLQSPAPTVPASLEMIPARIWTVGSGGYFEPAPWAIRSPSDHLIVVLDRLVVAAGKLQEGLANALLLLRRQSEQHPVSRLPPPRDRGPYT